MSLGTTATKAGTVAAIFGALGVGSLLSMAWLCKRYKDTSLIAVNLAVSANAFRCSACRYIGTINDA
jgi:hypothetical protein